MAKCCGPKAFTKKIKVGDEEIPVRGLEPLIFMVLNMKLNDDEKILKRLRNEIIDLGNIIPADNEKEFNDALLTEYKAFSQKITGN